MREAQKTQKSEKYAWANVVVFALILLVGMLSCFFKKPDKISETERRFLAQRPKITADLLLGRDNGLSDAFEAYAEDQFPGREQFRRLQAAFQGNIWQMQEIGGIVNKDGYLIKRDAVLREGSIAWSADRLRYLKDRYYPDRPLYLSIIPDKSAYQEDAIYDRIVDGIREKTGDRLVYLDLTDHLSMEDFYRTDNHWRQERLQEKGVARYLSDRIREDTDPEPEAVSREGIYTENVSEYPFFGALYGQYALPVSGDRLIYLTSDEMKQLKVWCYDTGKPVEMPVYDLQKLSGQDPYEVFLGGSRALIRIENPGCKSDRELVLFRDSFGSSIAPLLAMDYSAITLVDIRYISPALAGKYVDFENADGLCLFSASVLNNSEGQFLK